MVQIRDIRETRVFQEGLEEGRQEGRDEGFKRVLKAVELLKSNLAVEEIARLTGLPLANIRELKESLK